MEQLNDSELMIEHLWYDTYQWVNPNRLINGIVVNLGGANGLAKFELFE